MKEEACHPEHREGSPEQLSQQAQLLGDSHLRLRQVQVSLPSVVHTVPVSFGRMT